MPLTHFVRHERVIRPPFAQLAAIDERDRLLAETITRTDLLLASVRDAVMVTDLDGIVTYWNRAATCVFGWTAEEMLGEPITKRFPEEVRPAIVGLMRAILDGADHVGEFEDYHKDGSRIWIDARVFPIVDATGWPIGLMGTSHNITKRKRAEDERDRAIGHLRLQIDRMPLAYLLMDSEFRITEWNSAAERMFGYTREQMLGTGPPFEKIMPASAWPQGREILKRIRAGDMTAHSINENLTSDGRTITCEWNNTPLTDAEGAFAGLISLAQDVTNRRRAEEAVRTSEERFRQIAESITEVFWLTTLDKREIVYLSPAYEIVWGRKVEDVYASPGSWAEAIHPDDRDRVSHAALTKQATGEYDEEYRILRPDGTVRWIRDRAFPVHNAEEQVVRVAGVAEDITERRQLETQLYQAQKMEAVGQLAGGVAHDFNNHLSVIIGYSDLLLDDLREDAPSRELILEIKKAGERSASLTRQLLAFSRKQVLTPRILDVNDVVRDTEKMLRRLIGEDIELETMLHPFHVSVKADPGQLEHVLMNLAVNARDAMPLGGKLRIETNLMVVTRGHAVNHPSIKPGAYVTVAISDSGTGMTEEVKSHLFEPFFTTKAVGKGTGLGLAVVHGFIKQSGGHVDVQSEPGVGTSFTIYLPSVDGRAAAGLEAAAAVPALAGRNQTILLVEDEASVRALTKRILHKHGYTTLAASSGDEAVRMAERHGSPIDLLVTDVVMPGEGGRALAERLLAIYPRMKVLYVSGYTDDAVMRHGLLHNEVNFLQKPFSAMALAEKVRDVLAT